MMRVFAGLLLSIVRVALGALFVFAAWMKLRNPQAFADSVMAFKIFDLDNASHLVTLSTFAIPWLEMLSGLLLLVGLFSRAAAVALSAQLVAFTLGIISVLYRQLDASCGCFGKFEWPCPGQVSLCHVARNAALLALALLIVWRGGGLIGLDARRRKIHITPPPL